MGLLNFVFGVFLSLVYPFLIIPLIRLFNLSDFYSIICLIFITVVAFIIMWKNNKLCVLGAIVGIACIIVFVRMMGEMASMMCGGGVCL